MRDVGFAFWQLGSGMKGVRFGGVRASMVCDLSCHPQAPVLNPKP